MHLRALKLLKGQEHSPQSKKGEGEKRPKQATTVKTSLVLVFY